MLGALMHAVFLGFNIGAARTLQLGGSGPEAQCVRVSTRAGVTVCQGEHASRRDSVSSATCLCSLEPPVIGRVFTAVFRR